MAASGRPVEIVFTPPTAGVLLVTASFSAAGSGSDWGASKYGRCFCEQSGTTTYDGTTALGNTRAPYTLIGKFNVTAGAEVKCGFHGGVSGAAAVDFYDVFVRAELIKK